MRSRKATNAFGTGHNWFKSWLSMLGIFSPTCLWQIICLFYHCRLAMLAILFAPRGTYIKQYFALLGVLGSIAALVYPAFDPFPFPPYYCAQSDFFSHWALFANSLIYLQDFLSVGKSKTAYELLRSPLAWMPSSFGQPFDQWRLRLLKASTNHWRPRCSLELPLGQHCDGGRYLLGQSTL